MSTLNDLLRQVEQKDTRLAADIRREVEALKSRRAFGLNFERHVPESVELPGRPVRRGDKVRFLPERGQPINSVDRRLWRVKTIRRDGKQRIAELIRNPQSGDDPETASRAAEDLVVVAEFRDPIYPGLVSTGRIERGGDKPYHTVINAENFHALQALLYTHEGKVDAIYIDPPYNTGAKDWKYNNDYVDGEDAYRHSKWLAFMERRLKLAGRLLNPENSVLIVTIDEKEYLRLGLLLEQTFPNVDISMVTSVISAKGAVRPGRFSRVEEHIFFCFFGEATVSWWDCNMLPADGKKTTQRNNDKPAPIKWLLLRRREPTSVRAARPNQFYPIYVNNSDGIIHSIGDAIEPEIDRNSVDVPTGTTAIWPLKPDGTEMLWGLTPEVLRENLANGFVRVNNWKQQKLTGSVQYLQTGVISKIRSGEITITGYAEDGSVVGHLAADMSVGKSPKRVWNMRSHNAETGGTNMVSSLIPKHRFPFPKSLYAVEDSLRFIVANKKNAKVIDFFSGSGTTAHAVMRLNKQDGGHRQCISVTNNEVSVDEQKGLRKKGLRPGDPEWEKLGICDYITKPRLTAAITGKTAEGKPIKGNYKFTDEFPMADGFEENVEFFTMTYEARRPVAHHKSFAAIAPLLWLRAGAQGRRIDQPTADFAVADTYGVLFDLDAVDGFLSEIAQAESARMAFIVTDSDRGFQSVCAELPERVEAVRLYESYLTNFTINTGLN